ncbi:intermembrane phospholipid transport protein YdbH family protein [Cellvibrio polysaccharolyticus]|uniref:Dicarboxylate transport n=1 Tax=Cellvibrio polysaccharolyticus TaxID=2082724 RepID=A0A928V4K8_9GAMM|nr:YdbH domain-containing protein [Cellvibrio polysaccharolyticus]MBE8716492.1 hypothetical protein [Cellvibrio polysaccharolyticus]
MKVSLLWRRITIGLFIALMVIILVPAILLWQLPRIMERYGVFDARWQLTSFSPRQLVIEHASFRVQQPGFAALVEMRNFSVSWQWAGLAMPKILQVNIAAGRLRWLPVADQPVPEVADDAGPFTLPASWQLPQWLPQQIHVDHWRWQLPCTRAGGCELASGLQVLRQGQMLDARLMVHNTPEPLELSLQWNSGEGGTKYSLPAAQFTLAGGRFINAEFITSLVGDAAGDSPRWDGNLGLTAMAPDAAWLEFLGEWVSVEQWPSLDAFTNPVTLSLVWQADAEPLLAASDSSDSSLNYQYFLNEIHQRLHGKVELSALLLSAIPVPAVGDLSGQIRLSLAARDGVLLQHALAVESQVDALVLPDALATLDTGWQSLTLKAHSASAETPTALEALPLALDIALAGKVNTRLVVAATVADDLQTLNIEDGRLTLDAAQWQPLEGWQLSAVALDSHFSLAWQQPELRFSLLSPLSLAGSVKMEGLGVQGAQLALSQLELQGNPQLWQQVQLALTGDLAVAAIEQEMLQAHPWRWQGSVKANAPGDTVPLAHVDGSLVFDDRLTVTHKAILQESGWQAEVEMPDVFLLAGNPFALLTPLWPELLTLAAGRTGGKGKFSGDWQMEKLRGSLAWRLADVGGVYDTTAFRRATGTLNLTLGERLSLATDNLVVGEVVQGFTFAPITMSARYNAPLGDLMQGQVTLGKVEAGLLDGLVSVVPATMDFSKASQPLEIELTNVDLGRLLAEHPSSDLTGTGKISGRVPVELTKTGFIVREGRLAAQQPGGRLQYRSARVNDIAKTSEGMKVITDALDDFHYTVLDSGVSYDENGKLMLAVRLQGSNPALEGGRAINFNITLEEDLPAMIASLQLGNQLGDDIKKRVQQRIQRRSTP